MVCLDVYVCVMISLHDMQLRVCVSVCVCECVCVCLCGSTECSYLFTGPMLSHAYANFEPRTLY